MKFEICLIQNALGKSKQPGIISTRVLIPLAIIRNEQEAAGSVESLNPGEISVTYYIGPCFAHAPGTAVQELSRTSTENDKDDLFRKIR